MNVGALERVNMHGGVWKVPLKFTTTIDDQNKILAAHFPVNWLLDEMPYYFWVR